MATSAEYDPRYLAGIRFFNAGEFFDAHEVWEALWREAPAGDRPFYQGLIQAAVAAYHLERGNWRGARRLFHSGRAYMSGYPSPHLGLDVAAFWEGMADCLGPALGESAPSGPVTLDPARVPVITLAPAPAEWPAPTRPLESGDETSAGGRP
ncbi:MAG TPA: DUF309 domain-containing protein [Gemmataceae bacterium]